MDQILQLAPLALLVFGSVWAISFVVNKYTKHEMNTETKIALSVVLAFAFGFIPVDFQNEIANRLRDAVALTLGITGLYQAWKAS